MLLLAGDASEDIRVLRLTLTCLRDTFGKVFFLPGNHELWLRGGAEDPRWVLPTVGDPCLRFCNSLRKLHA